VVAPSRDLAGGRLDVDVELSDVAENPGARSPEDFPMAC
jgi:hypothetical protein